MWAISACLSIQLVGGEKKKKKVKESVLFEFSKQSQLNNPVQCNNICNQSIEWKQKYFFIEHFWIMDKFKEIVICFAEKKSRLN